MRKFLLIILFLFISAPAWAATYYVRNDGGTATQCTGLADAAYDGSGTGEACAWRSIATALPRTGARISGGDTLIIDNIDRVVGFGQAKYEISYDGVDIVRDGTCFLQNARQCVMADIPAGPSAGNPTRILGKNWQNCDGTNPNEKAQLWTEKVADHALAHGNNVEIQCLEITDHRECARGAPLLNKGGTVSDWSCDQDCSDGSCVGGIYGIRASGATNVVYNNLDVHGLFEGLFVASPGDMEIYNSRISANASAGWEADNGLNQDFTGIIYMEGVDIMWSGCIDKYPLVSQNLTSESNITLCYSQDQGGYGDAIGIGNNNPGNWEIYDSNFSFNVSDGLDLLHGGATASKHVHFVRSRAEGNAGQTLKVTPQTTVESSSLIGNCSFFHGKSYVGSGSVARSSSSCSSILGSWQGTYCAMGFNHCRAAGNTVSFTLGNNMTHKINNSTLTSNGDVGIELAGSSCTGSAVQINNSVLIGGRQAGDDTSINPGGGNDSAVFFYSVGSGNCAALRPTEDYNIIYGFRDAASSVTGSHSRNINPLLATSFPMGPTTYYQGTNADMSIASNSPARDMASESVSLLETPAVDFNNYVRGSSWDIGALEYGSAQSTPTCDDDCTICASQGACDASVLTCYWWTDSTCRSSAEPICGNGVVTGTEQCDDGNVTNNDGCSALCETEVSPYQQFLNYTEADPDGVLDVHTNGVLVNGMDRSSDTYLRYDFGSGYFTNRTFKFKVVWDHCSGDYCYNALFALSANAHTDLKQLFDNNDGVAFTMDVENDFFGWYIEQALSTHANYDFYQDEILPQVRYVEMSRSGAQWMVKIYRDAAYTDLIDILNLTATATPYRYLYIAQAYNEGQPGDGNYFTVENLDTGLAPVIPPPEPDPVPDPPPPPATANVGACSGGAKVVGGAKFR